MNLEKTVIEDVFLKEQLLLKKNKVFLPSAKIIIIFQKKCF